MTWIVFGKTIFKIFSLELKANLPIDTTWQSSINSGTIMFSSEPLYPIIVAWLSEIEYSKSL